MRIVQLSKDCSLNGGVGAYVLGLCRALSAAGHEVAVIHADRHEEPAHGIYQSFYVEDFDKFDAGPRGVTQANSVLDILATWQPEIVLIQGNNNFPLECEIRRRFAAIKFLHVYDYCPTGNKFHHASGTICQHPTGPLCLLRMGYKRCTLTKRPSVIWSHYQRCIDANENNSEFGRLIVASQYVKQQAIASGYLSSQISVLPYFTDLPALAPVTKQNRMVLFLGRIEREKGLDRLLQAVARMRTNSRLVIAGDGTDLHRVKLQTRRLRLSAQTEFVGWVSDDGRSKLYRDASVVVVPSVWPEPFGIVGIEAMSYGKPVVAFRVGGIPEWLENGVTGYTIAPYDVDEMATRLTYLLDHSEIAHNMGLCGRRSAEENFNSDRHVTQLSEILRDVIDARAFGTTPAI